MYQITINGREYSSQADKKLLTFLREDLGFEGTKDGCSEGACGACTVIIDGKATRSCVFMLSRLSGKSVTTIEGLSTREKEVYGYAFAEVGAVQCGYCTPGMIMSGKALLDKNLNPTREDVKKAIRGNICRCTGYIKIEDAILLAARYFRENIPVKEGKVSGLLGTRMRRVDALEKAMGTGRYVDDVHLEGMVHASAIRSTYPRARIIHIDAEEARKDPRCIAVFTAKDVPVNRHGHIIKDWPVLVSEGETTAYIGDAIALVVSEDLEALPLLKKLVHITYEELPGVFSPQEAEKNAILVHEGVSNLLDREHIVRGDAAAALSASDYTIHDVYTTPFTEHAFMEMECAIGCYDPKTNGVLVYSGSQSVYDEQREIAHILALSKEQVHCTSMLVGGGFGGKEDMVVQHHAALAAYLLKRPVKVKLSRQESLIVHPKRHPMTIDLTIGCDKNGILKAMKCTIDADTGAYASLGGPVLQRACTHAAGPYNYQNIDILGRAFYTNNVPAGAFRGFGVTQSIFAFESLLDRLAEKVGIDPFQIRYINALKPGDTMPNGQIASGDTGLVECLDAVKAAYYKNGRTGIACALKNSGIGVGLPDYGRCILSVENGKVHIRTSAACMGQGVATVTTMVTAETTGIAPELIIAEAPDTERTPNSGTSTASRQTAFTGEATRRAAEKLKKALEGHTLASLEGQEFYGEFNCVTDPITSDKPHPVSHLAYSYSAQVVELGEDGLVQKVTAACDAGTVINQTAIEGQIEGGVAMGLGFAFTEDFPMKDGYLTVKYGALGLLRATEIPQIETVLVHGKGKGEATYGAKGIGELCTIPTAPACLNAYYRRDGVVRTSLPLKNTAY